MKKNLGDGTPIQGGLRHYQRTEGQNEQFIPYPLKGFVTAVYPLDNQFNAAGEAVVCDVVVPEWGQVFKRLPFISVKSSADNYINYGPVQADGEIDAGTDAPASDKLRINPKLTNGDLVIIQFINGDPQQGIITGMFPHYQSGQDGSCPEPREGKDAKDHFSMRYNGLMIIIDKDGNLDIKSTDVIKKGGLLSLLGGADEINPNKKITITLKAPTQLLQETVWELDNAEDAQVSRCTIKTTAGDELVTEMDGAAKVIRSKASTLTGDEFLFEMDADSKATTLSTKSLTAENRLVMDDDGVTITSSKNMNVTFAEDATIQIDGSANITVSGETTIDCQDNLTATVGGDASLTVSGSTTIESTGAIDITCSDAITLDATGTVDIKSADAITIDAVGEATIKSAVKVALDAMQVELGTGASEAVIKGQTFQTLFNSHTHPTAVGSSGPPTIPLTGLELSLVTKTA